MFKFDKNNDVDPISEAEVYFAYQRDSKAIEILKEAYIKGNNELKEQIHEYLFKNNKMDLFKRAVPTVALNKPNGKISYKYRVHFTSYIERYSHAHKLNIICRNPKNTSLGLEEIERFIEGYNAKNMDKYNWVINFISEELQ